MHTHIHTHVHTHAHSHTHIHTHARTYTILQVLKYLALREDKGLGLCGGVDPILYLCESQHLVLHLLGLLHTLQVRI